MAAGNVFVTGIKKADLVENIGRKEGCHFGSLQE